MPPPFSQYVAFDHVAGCYEQSRYIPPGWLAESARLLASHCPSSPLHTRLLDVGVGTGRFARHLRGEGLAVAGADISMPMLRQAREADDELLLTRADVRHLPFRDGVFSAALVVHLLHLIEDWTRVVREIQRVLAPGCPLFIGSESGKQLRTRNLYFQIANEAAGPRSHIGAQSITQILDYLDESGAEVRRIDDGKLTWNAEARVAETIESLRTNPFSHLWHIPSEQHAAIMEELQRRLESMNVAPEEVESAPAQLSFWSVTWPPERSIAR